MEPSCENTWYLYLLPDESSVMSMVMSGHDKLERMSSMTCMPAHTCACMHMRTDAYACRAAPPRPRAARRRPGPAILHDSAFPATAKLHRIMTVSQRLGSLSLTHGHSGAPQAVAKPWPAAVHMPVRPRARGLHSPA